MDIEEIRKAFTETYSVMGIGRIRSDIESGRGADTVQAVWLIDRIEILTVQLEKAEADLQTIAFGCKKEWDAGGDIFTTKVDGQSVAREYFAAKEK
jgi:hypothetical protein